MSCRGSACSDRVVVRVDSLVARGIDAAVLFCAALWLIVLLAHRDHHSKWHAAGRWQSWLSWHRSLVASSWDVR